MSAAPAYIGSLVMIGAGLLVAVVFLAASAAAVGLAGAWLYKRLGRTYHLTVIWYWLPRLEKEGTHCFEKAPRPTTTSAATQPAINQAEQKGGV